MEILLIIFIFFSFGLRPFIYKPIAKKYPPAVAMIIDGIGAVFLTIIVLKFSNDKFMWHPVLFLTVISGIALSYQVKLFQIVLKESTSAQQYILIIALGIGVIINKIYGEVLTNGQIWTVIAIAFVAVLFFIRVVKRLSKNAINAWLLNLLLTALVISLPKLLLNYTNWITIFTCNAVFNLLSDIFEFNRCREELKRNSIKLHYSLIFVSLFVSLGELIFMYANSLLGVTTVLIIKRATIPFVIIVSYFIYKETEGNIFDQILFSVLAGFLVVFYFAFM